MRVVHVARYFHPHLGGTEQVIASLARELSAEGVESTVVVSDLDRTGAGPAPTVRVVEVPVVGPARFPLPRGRLGDVWRILRAADIVHLHDVRFLFEATALVRRGPVVVTTHGFVFHTDRSASAKALAWRGWIAPRLRRVDRVVAVSSRDAELCRSAGVDRVVTIPNGVDVDGFLAVGDRRRDEPVTRLLYFGRVAPEKEVGALAAVLRARPSWRLTVAGPADPAALADVAAAFGDADAQVSFVGAVAPDRLSGLLHDADCVVLPSRGESFGLTLVEAMAAGVPVVAADAPAYREVAGAAPVGFARFDDGEAAAQVIERTASGWDAAAARRRATEFSWRATASAYAKVYAEVSGAPT
jgi:phosphatidylinositol alpha-mannosyltransferase